MTEVVLKGTLETPPKKPNNIIDVSTRKEWDAEELQRTLFKIERAINSDDATHDLRCHIEVLPEEEV